MARAHGFCLLGLLTTATLAGGCGQQVDPLAMPPEKRQYDTAQLLRGEETYTQHCASCHGPGARGAVDWRRRDASGLFPPPPLNGTGHAWHHPLAQLRHTITNGGPAGQSNMPGWGAPLSAEQVDDVIAWFQSLWPDQIYEAWYKIEQRASRNATDS